MNDELSGRTALVTGAASGIGLAIARRLAAGGAHVVVSDIDEAAAKSAAETIVGSTAAACDVRDEDQVQALIETTVAAHGGLHILVPNAGIMKTAPLTEVDLTQWRSVTAINLDGVFLCLRYGAPAMIASGGGSIVTIGSITATTGTPLTASYAATKAAVVSLTKSAACEFRPYGVRVNTVMPGIVNTALVGGNVADMERFLDAQPGSFEGLIAMKQGRFGLPEEVAEAVAYFASDRSSFCTGSELIVDGGWTASWV